MALLNHRITFEAPTLDTADRVVWSFGYSGDDQPDLAEFMWDLFIRAWTTVLPSGNVISSRIHTGYRPYLSEIYDFTGGGPPLSVYTEAGAPAGGAGARPSEIQLAVSRMVDGPRGVTPRGRLFIGPWGGSSTSPGARPSAGEMADACDFMVVVHEDAADPSPGAVNLTPVVLGRTEAGLTSGIPIVEYRTDDLWDTQRRRGFEQRTTTVTRTPS